MLLELIDFRLERNFDWLNVHSTEVTERYGLVRNLFTFHGKVWKYSDADSKDEATVIKTLISNGNMMALELVTDCIVNYRGFHIRYKLLGITTFSNTGNHYCI